MESEKGALLHCIGLEGRTNFSARKFKSILMDLKAEPKARPPTDHLKGSL